MVGIMVYYDFAYSGSGDYGPGTMGMVCCSWACMVISFKQKAPPADCAETRPFAVCRSVSVCCKVDLGVWGLGLGLRWGFP